MPDPAWRPAAPVLLAISVAGAVAYLLLGAALKHHHSPDGLYEHISLGWNSYGSPSPPSPSPGGPSDPARMTR